MKYIIRLSLCDVEIISWGVGNISKRLKENKDLEDIMSEENLDMFKKKMRQKEKISLTSKFREE
ncbi:MAG: hypothetical protein VR72_17765 [Clostridiaceae bacterium BRH_c20a]|nr:MAG: hypothetical protein VR72_17765 [Clostridiaceae bacterium BRH_c20a]